MRQVGNHTTVKGSDRTLQQEFTNGAKATARKARAVVWQQQRQYRGDVLHLLLPSNRSPRRSSAPPLQKEHLRQARRPFLRQHGEFDTDNARRVASVSRISWLVHMLLSS